MNNNEIEKKELEVLKKDLEINELEDRLEMVNAAAASASRCTSSNDSCTLNGSCAADAAEMQSAQN